MPDDWKQKGTFLANTTAYQIKCSSAHNPFFGGNLKCRSFFLFFFLFFFSFFFNKPDHKIERKLLHVLLFFSVFLFQLLSLGPVMRLYLVSPLSACLLASLWLAGCLAPSFSRGISHFIIYELC